MLDGKIAEHGTYAKLMAAGNGEFARLMNEFGGKGEDRKKEEDMSQEKRKAESEDDPKKAGRGSALMQEEERNTGAIPLEVYKQYLSAARGVIVLPILFMAVALLQGAIVMSAYW